VRVWSAGGVCRRNSQKDSPCCHHTLPESFGFGSNAEAGNRRAAMASCRSKVRVAVRALVKKRERIRRRVRRLGASIARA
jgi:hypothetical protein